jgi:membrane-bound ClpP family serine protease
VTTVTRAVGAILIALGVIAYAVTGAASLTALLPAVPGLVILVLGVLAARESLHRHMIHAALVVALLTVLASLRMVVELVTGEVSAATITSLLMAVVAGGYVVLGVRSFIAARKARESTPA